MPVLQDTPYTVNEHLYPSLGYSATKGKDPSPLHSVVLAQGLGQKVDK